MAYMPKKLTAIYDKIMRSGGSIPRNDNPSPFIVTVTKNPFNEGAVDVKVRPEPIAVTTELLPAVSKRVTGIIERFEMQQNDERTRLKLLHDLDAAIQDMWKSGWIKPKPEDNTK